MSGFYMFISSDDCKDVFADNTFYDFTIEVKPEINLTGGSGFGEWAFALTDISLDSATDTPLPETCTVLCDLARGSYMSAGSVPILRRIDVESETSGSLFQTYYIGVNKLIFNRIRIYLRNRDLLPLDKSLWNSKAVLNLTLHFQKI